MKKIELERWLSGVNDSLTRTQQRVNDLAADMAIFEEWRREQEEKPQPATPPVEKQAIYPDIIFGHKHILTNPQFYLVGLAFGVPVYATDKERGENMMKRLFNMIDFKKHETDLFLDANKALILRDLRDRIRGWGIMPNKPTNAGALLDECLEVLDAIFGGEA